MRPNVVTDPKLVSLKERYEKLLNERAEISSAIKDFHQEVKSAGYYVAAFKETVRRSRETNEQHAKRIMKEEAIELMEAKLGDYATTALGSHAVAAAE